jgi:hypothetical protein
MNNHYPQTAEDKAIRDRQVLRDLARGLGGLTIFTMQAADERDSVLMAAFERARHGLSTIGPSTYRPYSRAIRNMTRAKWEL